MTTLFLVSLFFLTFGLPRSSAELEDKWRMCKKCKIMFWSGWADQGACRVEGKHEASGKAYFVHKNEKPANSENGWRYCQVCKGLFWIKKDEEYRRSCAGTYGGHHWNNDNYAVFKNSKGDRPSEAAWAYCQKCGAFYSKGGNGNGKCVRGEHQSDASKYYAVVSTDVTPTRTPTPTPDKCPPKPGLEHIDAVLPEQPAPAVLYYRPLDNFGQCTDMLKWMPSEKVVCMSKIGVCHILGANRQIFRIFYSK